MENKLQNNNHSFFQNCSIASSSEIWNMEFKDLESYIYSTIPTDDGFSDEDFARMKANVENKR